MSALGIYGLRSPLDEFGPRTVLLPLTAIGMGTPQVESLPSYLMRLATRNGISPGRFLTGPETRVLSKTQPAFLDLRLSATARWGNGSIITSERGKRSAAALGLLTGQNELKRLSFLTCVDGFSLNGVFRHHQCWCYDCLGKASVPYAQALWSFTLVTACCDHGTRLTAACLDCGAQLRQFHARSHFLRCHVCGFDNVGALPAQRAYATANELAVAKSFGKLLAETSSGRLTLSADRTKLTFDTIGKSYGRRSKNEQTRLFGADSRAFCDQRPLSLLWVLRLCLSRQLDIVKFLSGQWRDTERAFSRELRLTPIFTRTRLSKEKRFELISQFSAMASRTPPPSPYDLADELGVRYSFFRNYAPALFDQLRAGWAEYKRVCKQRRVEEFKDEVRRLIANDLQRDLVRSRRSLRKDLPNSNLTRRPELGSFVDEQLRQARVILAARRQIELPLLEMEGVQSGAPR